MRDPTKVLLIVGVCVGLVAVICLLKVCRILLWRCCRDDEPPSLTEMVMPSELLEHIERGEERLNSTVTAAAAATVDVHASNEWPPVGLSPGDANYRDRFVRGGL